MVNCLFYTFETILLSKAALCLLIKSSGEEAHNGRDKFGISEWIEVKIVGSEKNSGMHSSGVQL